MTNYLVYRHGANASNQPYKDVAPMAIVEAESEEAACAVEPTQARAPWSNSYTSAVRLALAPHITAWANQRFTAVPESEADSDDWNLVVEEGGR